MSTIVVQAFVTLDGVVQAGGPDEDRDGGWMMEHDEQMDKLAAVIRSLGWSDETPDRPEGYTTRSPMESGHATVER